MLNIVNNRADRQICLVQRGRRSHHAGALRFSANINTFNSCADRYIISGYGKRLTIEQLIEAATRVEGLTGVEVVGSGMSTTRT